MQQHVKVVAILHIIFGALGLCGALIVMLVFGGLASFVSVAEQSPDNAFAGGILGLIGVVVVAVVLLISLPELIAGIGLLNYQPWARVLTIVLSVFELPGFPFHTALGIYGLWALLSTEGTALFNSQTVRV